MIRGSCSHSCSWGKPLERGCPPAPPFMNSLGYLFINSPKGLRWVGWFYFFGRFTPSRIYSVNGDGKFEAQQFTRNDSLFRAWRHCAICRHSILIYTIAMQLREEGKVGYVEKRFVTLHQYASSVERGFPVGEWAGRGHVLGRRREFAFLARSLRSLGSPPRPRNSRIRKLHLQKTPGIV